MKLSKKQKEVIALMRKKKRLYRFMTKCGLESSTCSIATLYKIRELNLIMPFGKKNFGQEYVLTELGKSIPL